MNPYITIPREALVALLRSAGSPLTPEEYVASLPLPDAVLYRKYANRAWVAAVSKYFLLVVAVLAVVSPAVHGLYHREHRHHRGSRDGHGF